MGTPFVRINRETLAKSKVQLDVITPSLRYVFDEFEWVISSRLRSIFWRQPIYLRNTPGRPLSMEEQLDRSQWAAFLRSLLVFDMANWVNHPAAIYAAEVKPYQLRVAHQIGFKIPHTVVTNDVDALETRLIGDPFVLKSIDSILLDNGNETTFAYTTIVTKEECAAEVFTTIPSTCQALLSPKTDVRVTVIGEKVYSVYIERRGSQIEGDWRLVSKEDLEYHDYPLSEADRHACRSLLKHFGLRFGAIDLAKTDGELFFLEINPTGEWGWLTSPTRPLAREIACLLSGASA
jgi:hypothetical protein